MKRKVLTALLAIILLTVAACKNTSENHLDYLIKESQNVDYSSQTQSLIELLKNGNVYFEFITKFGYEPISGVFVANGADSAIVFFDEQGKPESRFITVDNKRWVVSDINGRYARLPDNNNGEALLWHKDFFMLTGYQNLQFNEKSVGLINKVNLPYLEYVNDLGQEIRFFIEDDEVYGYTIPIVDATVLVTYVSDIIPQWVFFIPDNYIDIDS